MLVYSEDGPMSAPSGGILVTVPIERHFYHCDAHGFLRYLGDNRFVRVE